MRDKFKEYYKLSKEEISVFWETAVFSFDANVLLNLYRYTESTCNEIIDIFSYLVDNKRIWVSYQAALEYQRNRLVVIDKQKNTYDDLVNLFDSKVEELGRELDKIKRHPYIETKKMKAIVTDSFKKMKEPIAKLKEQHPDFSENDPIFDKLTILFKECIGDPYSQVELQNIKKNGKERYEKKIPPGYKDIVKEKTEGESSYGDLIIWEDLIRKATHDKCKIIFVTDDLKEDWWLTFKGKTISPRVELLKEFTDRSAQEIAIYKPEQFLQYFKNHIKNELKEQTVKEVEELRKDDEKLQASNIVRLYGNRHDSDFLEKHRRRMKATSDPDFLEKVQQRLAAMNNPDYIERIQRMAEMNDPDYMHRIQRMTEMNNPDYIERFQRMAEMNDPDYIERFQRMAEMNNPDYIQRFQRMAEMNNPDYIERFQRMTEMNDPDYIERIQRIAKQNEVN